MSYIPVTVQKMAPDTEEWTDLLQYFHRLPNVQRYILSGL